MKVDGQTPNDLVLTLWGNERSRPKFEILVDGKPFVAGDLEVRSHNVYYDATYLLPESATRGKTTVRVRIQPKPTKVGPTVAGVRTTRRKPSL